MQIRAGPLQSSLAIIDGSVYAAAMSYLGSKAASGAFQAIIALMPPHDTYVELFAGSGAVLLGLVVTSVPKVPI